VIMNGWRPGRAADRWNMTHLQEFEQASSNWRG
jgi:hypothetical protein